MAEGYRDPRYVASLAAWGTPLELPRSGGWLLERPIPGTDLRDAMGPYPLLACRDWAALDADLAALTGRLVSVVAVTDPFADLDEARLRTAFPDHVRPFRPHHVIDLDPAAPRSWTVKHEQQARRALGRLEIVLDDAPAARADEWTELYAQLVARHGVTGLRAFSRASFAALLAMPGVSLMLAHHEGRAVAGQVYLRQDDVVHCHLGAATPEGYRLDAFRAMDRASVDRFRGTAAWLDLGGGQGSGDATDGLASYKARWSPITRMTWLGGRILDADAYAALGGDPHDPDGWFPSYRAGTGV